MMDFGPFPKVFAIGSKQISGLFSGRVEITEKLDGSQFGFGRINGEIVCRSKGKVLVLDAPEKMFQGAVDYVLSISEKIPDNTIFYGEWFQRPKHNVLAYSRVPKNGIALFGAIEWDNTLLEEMWCDYQGISSWASDLGIEPVPLLFEGEIDSAADFLSEMLEAKSVLGGQKIEGVVVKNYNQPCKITNGVYLPISCGKFVSERFKEVHQKTWGKENTGKGRWETFKEQFCTEARWDKAVQHLGEAGELLGDPKDIGALIKEVQRDISEEEKENIKDALWGMFGKDVLRTSVRGLPEWYKRKLLERA